MPATIPDNENSGPVMPNNLPRQRRIITTHTKEGASIFDTSVAEEVPVQILDETASAALSYLSDFPADFTDDKDVTEYAQILKDPPGLSVSKGTILRTFDMGPGVHSPLHRTVSLDYVACMYGALEITLDSGEVRVLRAGDILINRGSLHAWRNVGEGWARMLAVLVPVKDLVVGGVSQKEHLGGIEGFKDSE